MTPFQTLGHSLDHWQAIYIVSITIALLSTFAIVVFAFHIQQHKHGLKVSNYIYVMASLLAVVSTIVIVVKTHSLDAEKDRLAKAATDAASVQVAQAQKVAEQAKAEAATANQRAQEAHDKAVTVEGENLKLTGRVGLDATEARTAEAALEKANKKTSDFAHSLQEQQGVMQEQAKLSPVLNPFQIQTLASELAPFRGQEVILHSTGDTTVLRTKVSVAKALQGAGITFPSNSMDMGSLYQGVSVVIHSPQNVPPLAEALVKGLRQTGIDAHPVSLETIPIGKVALYFGPN